jgi:ribosomal protein S8
MRELILISKPSRRVYVSLKELRSHPFQLKKSKDKVINKGKQPFYIFNSWVLSTSKGVLTGNQALNSNVGGELICCIR